MPVNGLTRINGPVVKHSRKGMTMFATLGTINDSFQTIFSGGAGEEDSGRVELSSGSGQANVILNSSGNFKVGVFGNYDGNIVRNIDYWRLKLYLVGYCL